MRRSWCVGVSSRPPLFVARHRAEHLRERITGQGGSLARLKNAWRAAPGASDFFSASLRPEGELLGEIRVRVGARPLLQAAVAVDCAGDAAEPRAGTMDGEEQR